MLSILLRISNVLKHIHLRFITFEAFDLAVGIFLFYPQLKQVSLQVTLKSHTTAGYSKLNAYGFMRVLFTKNR